MSSKKTSSRVVLALPIALLLLLPGCPRSSTDEADEVAEAEPSVAIETAKTAEPPRSTAKASTTVSAVRIAGVKATLDRHLRRWALKSPENTWALLHALFVFPPDMELPDHDLTLLDAILSEATTVEVGGRTVPTFTGQARDGTPREPHPNQAAMVLLVAGIDPGYEFEADGRTFTVSDLVESALWRFEPPSDEGWEHESWTLTALAFAHRDNRKAEFTNYKGQRFDGRELAKRSAAHLNREMEFIENARDSGQPLRKEREGVHAHPCGGLHLASTPAMWMTEPDLRDALVSAMERAASTLAWRVEAEHEVYQQTRESFPSHDIMISAQEMKFYGHWLETMADLRDAGIDVDREAVDKGIAFLVQAVERLDQIGTFRRMEDVRERRVQTYRDLIGDAAHALRGLRLWTEVQ